MTLLTLPSVLKRRVASFLDHKTAIALSRTSKKLHSDLTLLPLEPCHELVYSTIAHGEVMTGDVPVKSFQIPVFYENPHTVCLKCQWKDQGWGNLKGRIYVVEHDDEYLSSRTKDDDDDDENQRAIDFLFGGGKIIYKSPLASHELEPLEISFVPKSHAGSCVDQTTKRPKYHLWFVVGGGGGHLLIVENLYVHTLVFDDCHRTMSKAYASLMRLPVHPSNTGEEDAQDNEDTDSVSFDNAVADQESFIFCAKLLKCLALTLLKTSSPVANPQHQVHDSKLKSFFTEHQLQTDSYSLSAVTTVCDFVLTFLSYHDHLQWDVDTPMLARGQDDPRETVLPKFILSKDVATCTEDDKIIIPATRIPFLHGVTKTVHLKVDWEGPSDGKLYLVAKPINEREKHQNSFSDRGRIVWESPTLPEEPSETRTEFDVVFSPHDHERYILYRCMGSSDSTVHELSIQVTISEAQRSSGIEWCFSLLLLNDGQLDVCSGCDFSFLLDMVEVATSFLLENLNLKSSPIQQLFTAHGVSVDESSLRCLSELLACCRDLVNCTDGNNSSVRPPPSHAAAPLRMFAVM